LWCKTDEAMQIDCFADVQILSYEVPGFDELSLQEKKLAYFLSQAELVNAALKAPDLESLALIYEELAPIV